jgi:hypothetical protein
MRKKIRVIQVAFIATMLTLLCHIPGWADTYFRDVVNTTMERQIEERRSEIDAQMQHNIRQALHDKNTQEQIQGILRNAVAAELEENGESHLRKVIERRAPHAMPFLFPDETHNSPTTSGG